MTYEVLARKWRPMVFPDVIGQEHITQTLLNAINSDRLAHAYLFSGARGVGKTSVARILAKALNCHDIQHGNPCGKCSSCVEITGGSSVDVQEIDGASNRGIDEIRELRENIKYMPSSGRYRVYIIDEVHMLTLQAFNALLKTLEEPPPHVKFIFATTEPHKVPVTILSRCQRFDFKRIPVDLITTQLEKIIEKEGIEISRPGLSIIAREAEGSMRDAESLLDQVISSTESQIEEKDIIDILGIIDRDLLFETSKAIFENFPGTCIEIVEKIYNYGYDIKEYYRALMDHFRDLIICLIAPDKNLLDMIGTDRDELLNQAKIAGVNRLQQSLNILIHQEEALKFTSHPRLVLETILIKLCQVGDLLSFGELIEKIELLEERITSSPIPRENSEGFKISEPKSDWGGTEKQDLEKKNESEERCDWEDFLRYVAERNIAMSNNLGEWAVKSYSGDTIELVRGHNSFSSSYLDDPDRFAKFISYCKDYFGKEIKIEISEAKNKPSKKKENKNEEPPRQHTDLPKAVQEVLQVFNGEIKGEVEKNNKLNSNNLR